MVIYSACLQARSCNEVQPDFSANNRYYPHHVASWTDDRSSQAYCSRWRNWYFKNCHYTGWYLFKEYIYYYFFINMSFINTFFILCFHVFSYTISKTNLELFEKFGRIAATCPQHKLFIPNNFYECSEKFGGKCWEKN